jgi:peroxiredoxin
LSVESNRAHTAFAEQLDLPFPLLSDLNREVVREYGVMYTREKPHREGFFGISKRAVFVLDRDGVVRYAWITDDALVEPNVDEVLKAVQDLSPGR